MGANRSTVKTIVMLASLVLVLGAGTACFGLFSKKEPATTDPCAGLTGQARTDCESQKAR